MGGASRKAHDALKGPLTPIPSTTGWDYYSQFAEPVTASHTNIVYSPDYNVGLLGIENFHPFDSKKYSRIASILQNAGIVNNSTLKFVKPRIMRREHLQEVHTEEYLSDLSDPKFLAKVIEFPPAAFLSSSLALSYLVYPMLMAVSGTITAAQIALQRGWSVNLGGGMHHASFNAGGGWCAFSDIFLAIQHLRRANPGRQMKFAIVDLDAHQGNGHERDKLMLKDKDTFIMDVYNANNYPRDIEARRAIDLDIHLTSAVTDAEYLQKVREGITKTLNFKPDLVIYNAGTDILNGDPLGHFKISPEAVIERDEIIFRACKEKHVPVMMVLSGGYTKPLSGTVTGNSIVNFVQKLGLKPEGSWF